MAYSGFNLPDGCRPEDIPGNEIRRFNTEEEEEDFENLDLEDEDEAEDDEDEEYFDEDFEDEDGEY